MKITLDIPDTLIEQVVKELMENFPEASDGCSLQCDRWNYEKMSFQFSDGDQGKSYLINKEDLMKAFPLIFSDKWPKGCTQPPTSNLLDYETWNEWLCQCDATDHDAFAQLVCFGEVIYG